MFQQIKSLTINNSPLTINIYPNPAKDVVTISSKEPISKLLITDYLGREIATGTNLSNDGNLKLYTLNLKLYPKGLYVVRVVTNSGKVYNEKMIMQ